MKITRQTLDIFLLASLMAFSPALISAKVSGSSVRGHNMASPVQMSSSLRFLQEESMEENDSGDSNEGDSVEEDASNESAEESGASASGDSENESSADLAFRAGPQKRECEMCKY